MSQNLTIVSTLQVFSKVRPSLLCFKNNSSILKNSQSVIFSKLESFGSKVYSEQPKYEPNYFFCIRLNNKEVNLNKKLSNFNEQKSILNRVKIIQKIDNCQKEIILKQPELAKAICRVDTMHITMCVMYLKDKSQIDL